MKKILLVIGLVISLGFVAGCGTTTPTNTITPTTGETDANTPAAQTPATTQNSVSLRSMTFSPAALTVAVGTTVTWTNLDNVPHTVTGSGLSSPTLQNGQTYSFTFTSPGTYAYKCSIHPTMTGAVTVQ